MSERIHKKTLEVYGTSAADPQRIYIDGVEITDWLRNPIQLVEERPDRSLDGPTEMDFRMPEVHAVIEVQLGMMVHKAAEENPYNEEGLTP